MLPVLALTPSKTLPAAREGRWCFPTILLQKKSAEKRILGIDKDTWHRYRNERSWFYEVTTQGYRYHMSNINAAIGLAQLRKLDMFIEKKKSIVKSYDESFRGIDGIKTLKLNHDETAPFSYIIRVLDGRRDEMMDFLNRKGVGTGVHYIANHMQPYFSCYAQPMPVTEAIWKEILTLPLYYDMTDKDVALVVQSVNAFFKN